jgi:Nif-specific regulatory protein
MPDAFPSDSGRQLMESAARMSVRARVLERLLCLFTSDAPDERLWTDILDAAMEGVPCEASSLFLSDAKGALTIVAARGRVSEGVIGLKLKKGQGIAGACLLDGRTLAVSDVASDPRHAAALAKSLGFETRSILAVPVTHGDRALGVLEVINKAAGNEFQRHEVDLVERVGRSAGDVLALRARNGKTAKRKGR